jgi:hypothetical protein
MGLCRIRQGQFDAAKFHHHCVLKTGGGDARLGRHVVVFTRVAADPTAPTISPPVFTSTPPGEKAIRPSSTTLTLWKNTGLPLARSARTEVSASMARAPAAFARAMSSRAKLAPSSRESDGMAALVQHDHGQRLEALRAGIGQRPGEDRLSLGKSEGAHAAFSMVRPSSWARRAIRLSAAGAEDIVIGADQHGGGIASGQPCGDGALVAERGEIHHIDARHRLRALCEEPPAIAGHIVQLAAIGQHGLDKALARALGALRDQAGADRGDQVGGGFLVAEAARWAISASRCAARTGSSWQI